MSTFRDAMHGWQAWVVAIGLIAICLSLALEFNVFSTNFWGVRQADANRRVFEQSQSYVEGKRQELVKLYHEWSVGDEHDKATIEAMVRMNFANFDDNLVADQKVLYDFLVAAKY